jgi:ubiquitin C-terminal hydrolase
MDDYCRQAWESLGKFSLIGVVVHKGPSSESGHYTSFSKRTDGRWWYCNDRQVQLVTTEEHILKPKKSAYILVY